MKLRAYIVALHAALFAILLAVSPAGSGSMTLLGAGKAGAGGTLPSLDGSSAQASSSTGTLTLTLTTTASSGVAVVAVIVSGSLTSVVGSGTASALTFTQRGATVGPVGGNRTYEFTAPYSAAFAAGTITVTLSGAVFATASAFGVTGVPTSSFFDTDASLPAQNANAGAAASASFSTSHAKDFLYFIAIPGGGGTDTPTGSWNSISGSNFLTVFYQIVSATQTSQTVAGTNGSYGGSIVDAIAGLP